MAAFSSLLDILAEVPDPRRAEGKLYKLPHVLLFSILAIISGSNSYRGIVTFIDGNCSPQTAESWCARLRPADGIC